MDAATHNPTTNPRLLSVDRAAVELGVTVPSLRWLLHHRRDNGLQDAVVRLGRRLMLDREALSRWVNGQRERKA